MSRAFVREHDTGTTDGLPDRPFSEHPNDVTETGMAQIEAALNEARAAHAAAQASSDASAIATTAREVRYWSVRRATARVVPVSTDTAQVRFGATVTIVRDDGRKQTFRIVGEDEADPANGSISHVSPLARAMLGKRVGDVVRAGSGEAEITAIEWMSVVLGENRTAFRQAARGRERHLHAIGKRIRDFPITIDKLLAV